MNKKLIKVIVSLLILSSFLFIIFLFFYSPVKNLKVNFLDIGQGSSIFIQTPYGQNILIDGGDTQGKVLRELSQVMPFYDRTIDLIILTHPHEDHVGGLIKVLKRYKVKQILYTGASHTSPVYLEFLQAVRGKNIKMTIITEPQNIVLGQDLNLEILYPFNSFLHREVESLNNTSIVSLLKYKEHKFLFMGDIEQDVEEEFLKHPLPLGEGWGEGEGVDVMLAGHHGSNTSSSQEFLDMIKPKFAVIQSGVDNEFGHPSLRVLRRFDKMGILYFRNDLEGRIEFVSNGINLANNSKK